MIEGIIEVDGISFKYDIIEAFSEGSAKCLTIYRANEGLNRLPFSSPIIKKVMGAVKENPLFQKEVDVNCLIYLDHKEFIAKGDSFIMSDLAKI